MTSTVLNTKRSLVCVLAALSVTALTSTSMAITSASAAPSIATVTTLAAGDVALTDGLVEHTGGWEVANAELNEQGRIVSTLFPHQGRVFAGHGNYSANSGSTPVNDGTDIGSYDPATGTHVTEMDGFTTEEVQVFREIDGALYTPNVDPTGATAVQPYVTNASGTWGYAGEPVADAIHIFDIAKLGDEWFLFGSAWTSTRGQAGTVQAAATIWSSADGLTDWTVVHQAPETAANYDGYERFYWGATHGDTLYAAATEGLSGTTPHMVQYRDGVWSDAPVTSPDGSWLEYLSAQNVHSTDAGVVFANGDQINIFDGTSFTTVPVADGQYVQAATLAEDGNLYLLTSNGAISSFDTTTHEQVQLWQGTDEVLMYVTDIALLDGTVYFAAVSADGTSTRMVTLELPGDVDGPGDVEGPGEGEGPGDGDDSSGPNHPKPGHPHGTHPGQGHGKDKPKPNKPSKTSKEKPGKDKPQPSKPGKK